MVVAEPRRVAARAAARRMSALLGERPGRSVGHTVRGESTVGPGTRVEVVTTGVLVRRLQRDPELAGTGAVVLDECHERHLDTDLALAFGVDVRAALRPDLLLLAMSATAQAERVADALGGVPVVEATGALHPVEPVWCPPPAPVAPPHGLRVDPRLLDHVADVVRRAHAETAGDLLVFLPGAGEVGAVAGRLHGLDVVPLHGRLSAAAQDDALRQRDGRRVVLATSVAESSLTVPGVRTVVDAGLARVPRTDLARGLGSLVTVPVSRASAAQRAGRAGREAPGRAYRCWSAADHERLPAHAQPEVATADLTAFALELACWGAPGGRGLALLDVPPQASMDVATAALHDLGAVDERGAATPRGRALTAVGAHPRLARALLDGAPLVGSRLAAEVVAVLVDDAAGAAGDDLAAVLRALRSGRDRAATARWQDEVRRLERAVPPAPPTGVPVDLAAGLVVGLALPERLARRRDAGAATYLMAGGTGAELAPGTALTGADWLAVAVADRPPGRRDARIRLAVAVDEATAREAGATLLRTADGGRLARRRRPRPRGRASRRGRPARAAGGRPVRTRPARRCRRACAARGSRCCAGRPRPGCCVSGSPRARPGSATRGPPSTTTRCSRRWTCPALGRAATCSGSTWRPRCARSCRGRSPAASTSWRPSASGWRAAPTSASTTPTRRRPRCGSRCRRCSAGPAHRSSPVARCGCTCSPRPTGSSPSRATSRRSGRPATRACGPTCAAATRGTPGRRTRRPRRRRPVRPVAGSPGVRAVHRGTGGRWQTGIARHGPAPSSCSTPAARR